MRCANGELNDLNMLLIPNVLDMENIGEAQKKADLK